MGDVMSSLPAIEILGFDVEWRPRPRRIVVPSGPHVEVAHPVRDAFDAVWTVVARARRRYDATIGSYAGLHPRREPAVEQRLHRSADDVIAALRQCRFAREVDEGWDVQLRLPWSWPGLPMRLTIDESSSRTCALRLSLRSRRRLRYPARYYDAAHTALDLVKAAVA